MRNLPLILLLTTLLAAACGERADDATTGRDYLFVSNGGLTGPLRSGDILRVAGEELQVTNVFTGRDTAFPVSGARNVLNLGPDDSPRLLPQGSGEQQLVALSSPVPVLDSAYLTQSLFLYRYGGKEYWASFEPAFTGFPEYAREGTLDFVNRLVDWSATAPGLEFSEYQLIRKYGQPLLILSERQRGQYLGNQIIVVDSAGADGFSGRILTGGAADNVSITFTRTDGLADDYRPDDFVEEVNGGFSRSYLLLDRERRGPAEPTADKRLPRRSLIDPGDLGEISASFLDDGSVMFLSNDHIVLQGSYVLDLDKGLLTVTDDTGGSYRIFVGTEGGITFTLPVSVVQLDAGRLVGEDNYLRIEVVEG